MRPSLLRRPPVTGGLTPPTAVLAIIKHCIVLPLTLVVLHGSEAIGTVVDDGACGTGAAAGVDGSGVFWDWFSAR